MVCASVEEPKMSIRRGSQQVQLWDTTTLLILRKNLALKILLMSTVLSIGAVDERHRTILP